MLTHHFSSYHWVINHINQNSRNKARTFSALSTFKVTESGNFSMQNSFLPGYGVHYFGYKGRWIKVERQKEKQMLQQRDHSRAPLETVTLTTYGKELVGVSGLWGFSSILQSLSEFHSLI
jgi:chaperone BCS1